MNFDDYKSNQRPPSKQDFTTTWYYHRGQPEATTHNSVEKEAALSYFRSKDIVPVFDCLFRAEEWRAAHRAYSEEEGKLFLRFKEDALKDIGLWDHPKAEKAWELAWERGHSSGYSEVYNELLDLANLLLD